MQRNIIEIDGQRVVRIPCADVWMSEMELVELFDVIAPTLRAAIRAVYKSGVLNPCEVEKRIKLPNGYITDVYALPMVVALAFRIDTQSASNVRKCPTGKVVLAKRKASLVGFNGQQPLMQMLDCVLCKLLLSVYERFNLMY